MAIKKFYNNPNRCMKIKEIDKYDKIIRSGGLICLILFISEIFLNALTFAYFNSLILEIIVYWVATIINVIIGIWILAFIINFIRKI